MEELQVDFRKENWLIKGFVSRRTKRPFDANLILKDNGSIGFEFPPRPPKQKKENRLALMPIYQYQVIDSKLDNEIIEIEQSIGDKELNEHPITGEP